MGSLSLSLFFGYHDSSVTVSDDREVLLHLEAERVLRRKHCVAGADEMERVVGESLVYVGRTIADVDRVYLAQMKNPWPPGPITIQGRCFDPIITRHHENHIGTVLDHGFDDALIAVADGGSEDGSTRVYYHNAQGDIRQVADLDETPANGKFYGSLTMLVIDPDFFKAHGWYSGKTMGLSAYGTYRQEIADTLRDLTPELLWGNVLDVAKARAALGLSDDYARPWLDERRRDVARTGQQVWVEAFAEHLGALRRLSPNIAMVGGCALNVLLNSRLIDSGLFERIHVGPASGDCGQSLGAPLFHERGLRCSGAFLGRAFGDVDTCPPALIDDLLDGKLVAWYQGRAEVGPRALGHRSLLGLPSTLEMRDRMNRLKGREPYRPVAPMLPRDYLRTYFETDQRSPYMSFAPRAREITRENAPAIVHADGTSRVQTLDERDNPILHSALRMVGEATGTPILMNTSFNFDGEPIVDTPDDAERSFAGSGADVLYINGERVTR